MGSYLQSHDNALKFKVGPGHCFTIVDFHWPAGLENADTAVETINGDVEAINGLTVSSALD
jgi:hypothetical protein